MKIIVSRNEGIEIKESDTVIFTDAKGSEFRIKFDKIGILSINKYSDDDSTLSIIPNVSNQINIL